MVAGALGELGVDVHDVVAGGRLGEQAPGHEEVVEGLAVPVEDEAVALACRQGVGDWVQRLTHELEEEIVDRQASAARLRVVQTKKLVTLADECQKLLRAHYANAIPLELLKIEQDRITTVEERAKAELSTTEADLAGWQEVLKLAIKLAGSCHEAYLKARRRSAAGSTRLCWRPSTSRMAR